MGPLTKLLKINVAVSVPCSLVSCFRQLGASSQSLTQHLCESLEPLLAGLSIFNVIGEEDASSCFAFETALLDGYYCLFAGGLLLYLLSLFSSKATSQYFLDAAGTARDALDKTEHEERTSAEYDSAKVNIRPPPVFFTDVFRVFLRLEEAKSETGYATSCKESEEEEHDMQTLGQGSNEGNISIPEFTGSDRQDEENEVKAKEEGDDPSQPALSVS